MNKLIIVATNVMLGNLILWFFETTARKQDGLDPRYLIGFSIAAVFLLLIAFRLIERGQSLARSILLAGGVSFLVPVLGLMFSFLNLDSLNGSLVGAFIAIILGSMAWQWALPMFLLNSFFFARLARGR